MNKYIYKITNLINGKIYIGQSVDPIRRFSEHCNNCNYVSLIHQAIKKYGKENFEIKVIDYGEDYNEKEKYWIKYYNSLIPNGYNIAIGGEEPPAGKGEKNSFCKTEAKTVEQIKKELQNWNIPLKQIIVNNHTTRDIVRHINKGESWYDENLKYPLRPTEKELNEIKAKMVIDKLKNSNLTQKEIAFMFNLKRSAVTMINIGKNHRQSNIDYPIRK